MNLLLPIMLVVMVVMLYFSSKKQKQAQQDRQNQINSMKAGDEIVTIGGLHGLLHEVNTEKGTITLDCEGVYLEFDRNSIRTIKPQTTNEVVAEESAEEVASDEKTEE
ncbi:preprotein translocase subunit YajC [Pilibacter termitis]|uniref:Preprotein translocase subunit YajC n=1 Tax=Pilibacter termitis TaxID=263852 RepID=A0A1T4L3F8_9ENTE|nr:preprotein translocase subunit YajC [Pilibacter termitis]SJZ49077.1 preprotein translocase subunit YajC [Pilibacter termitis]